MKKQKYFTVVCLALLLNSCLQKDCYIAQGDAQKETRTLPPFTQIQINDDVEVELIQQNNTEYVELVAGSNILPKIELSVEGNTLIIKNKTTCNWVRNNKNMPKAKVYYKNLTNVLHQGYSPVYFVDTVKHDLQITILGYGDVSATTNNATMGINLYKYGNVILEGTCTSLFVDSYNHGFFRAKNLVAKQITAIHQGEGDFELQAQQNLSVEMLDYGVGNVYYKGNPTIQLKRTTNAKGNLIKID
ncbi:MAG: DUF2807 domain-containing protein [Cytophagales bacterium]|nr:MAG: DUF2807 domain-containing protein [Cytophagales bacterium]